MSAINYKITFQPLGRSVMISPETTVMAAAALAGLDVAAPCGGHGTCGKCRVRIVDGAGVPSAPPLAISEADWAQGWRLACQLRTSGDMIVEVPESSLVNSGGQRIQIEGNGAVPLLIAQAISRRLIDVPPATREDDMADVERIERSLGAAVRFPMKLLRELPRMLRDADWRIALVCDGDDVLEVCAAQDSEAPLGVAFDLGTTTVVGTLYELESGRELAVAAGMNGQIPFGDDLLSRIERTREAPQARDEMQCAAAETLSGIIAELCRQTGAAPEAIFDIALAGNTAMQQMICGIDTRALGELPFAAAFSSSLRVEARDLGLSLHQRARAFVFPQIGGFVGGDTVACIIAAGLDRVATPTLMIDIGTNGEIVLALPDGRMLCASTAAGPAFEGARISQGMRAARGAIDRVDLRGGEIECSVIGGGVATGICGTGLIDAVAAMLELGVLESTGLITARDELPQCVAESTLRRVMSDEGNSAFVLSPMQALRDAQAAESEGGVRLTQRDIRELQLASGALRAGAETLMEVAGITPVELGAVMLAGSFGNYIRKENAIRIGLLPPVPTERVHFIGNAASQGARVALLSVEERRRADAAALAAEHLDLGANPNFQMAFANAMMFPEGR